MAADVTFNTETHASDISQANYFRFYISRDIK